MLRLKQLPFSSRSIQWLCFTCLILLALFSRIYSTTRYDFTEDEIFALEFNQVHSFTGLITAPDFDHPPLWYMAMDPLVDLKPSVFTLRFVQILIFTSAIGISFWLLSPFPLRYRVLPLGWLALNPYVIHLTAGYLMYASVLGATLISFSWVLRILWRNQQHRIEPSKRELVGLSLLMAVGLLFDYSFFLFSCFLLVFAGLGWIQNKSRIWRVLLGSVVLSGLFDIWYLPIFWKNLFLTAHANQWAPVPSLKEFVLLLGDLFGFVDNLDFKWLFVNGLLIVASLLVIALLLEKSKKRKSPFPFLLNQWIALGGMIAAFVVLCVSFQNSFFYARVCFTFIVPITFTLIFSVIPYLKKNMFLSAVFFLFIFLTAFSFFDYYRNTDFYYWDFHANPVKMLLNQSFPTGSCLFTTPDWIYSSVVANMPAQSNVRLMRPKVEEDVQSCVNYYYIDQTTILEKPRRTSLQKIKDVYGVCFKSRDILVQDNVTLRLCD